VKTNPYESPAVFDKGDQMRRGSDDGQRRLRRTLVIGFYLLVATLGAIQAVPLRDNIAFLLFSVLAASMATYLCVLDARMRGRPIVQSVHWIMFCTWPLAVPIYLIYSRRLWGLVLLFLHGIGLLVVQALAFHLTRYLAYGNLWFDRFGR
jgi:hypothetical protein